jgi:hypothetical protein
MSWVRVWMYCEEDWQQRIVESSTLPAGPDIEHRGWCFAVTDKPPAPAFVPLERQWRSATGCSHEEFLIAQAGMFRRFAARLLDCLKPPKYLALPAPTYPLPPSEELDQAQLEPEALPDDYLPCSTQCALASALDLLSDSDFIAIMFALYTQGQPLLR